MTGKSIARWVGPACILLVGIIGMYLTKSGVIPNFLFKGNFHLDLSALIFTGSLLIALVWAAIVIDRLFKQKKVQHLNHRARIVQAEDKLRFLRRLDHELKNPITTIRLGVANLQQQYSSDAGVSGSLAHITNQVQRLQLLVENLRRLAEMDESSLDRAMVDLAEVIKEAVELAGGADEYRARKVELAIQQVPWPVARIWADRDLLLVALRNLIENALKYSAPDGRVQVRASEDGHQVLIEVDDDGRGIPPEDLPHIFDELSRGSNARDLPGSGLGLALARRIIELHHGSLTINSRLGQGTMARVQLPILDQ